VLDGIERGAGNLIRIAIGYVLFFVQLWLGSVLGWPRTPALVAIWCGAWLGLLIALGWKRTK
jgi:hypothetical protein